MNKSEQYKLSKRVLDMFHIFKELDDYFTERALNTGFSDENEITVYTRVFNNSFGYPMEIMDEQEFEHILTEYIIPLYQQWKGLNKKKQKFTVKNIPESCYYTKEEVFSIIWFVEVYAQYAGISANDNDWINGKWYTYARI